MDCLGCALTVGARPRGQHVKGGSRLRRFISAGVAPVFQLLTSWLNKFWSECYEPSSACVQPEGGCSEGGMFASYSI